jgi:hypothetical protein
LGGGGEWFETGHTVDVVLDARTNDSKTISSSSSLHRCV